jgi:hypothetical protein
MNRFTDTDINELNKLLENDTNKYLFVIRPCYENHSSYTAIAFYDIPVLSEYDYPYLKKRAYGEYISPNDVYSRGYDETNSNKIKEPYIELSSLFSIQSELIDEFYNIFKFISESVIGNKYYDGPVLKEFIFNENVVESKKTTSHILYDKEFTRFEYTLSGYASSVFLYKKYLDDTIAYFKLIYGFDEKGNNKLLLNHRIGDVVCMKSDNSVEFIILDYIYDNYNKIYSITYKLSKILTNSLSSVISYDNSFLYKIDKDLTYSRNDRINNILS